VDDWEQHFVEKSRRRFDKERAERRRRRGNRLIAAVALGSLILVGILALAIVR
jgi:hypothetical protein